LPPPAYHRTPRDVGWRPGQPVECRVSGLARRFSSWCLRPLAICALMSNAYAYHVHATLAPILTQCRPTGQGAVGVGREAVASHKVQNRDHSWQPAMDADARAPSAGEGARPCIPIPGHAGRRPRGADQRDRVDRDDRSWVGQRRAVAEAARAGNHGGGLEWCRVGKGVGSAAGAVCG
jgi:hypothetical protein